ncbi:MAG: hypothetical protein ACM3SY_02650 [Candidatus Omnitrophota bacterium]
MKQRIVILLLLFAVMGGGFFSTTGCAKAKTKDALSLMPEEASGVVVFNFNRFAQMPTFDKMIKNSDLKKKETENPGLFKDYQDFVNKTGIDPKRDINTVLIGLMGNVSVQDKDANIVMILNLKYDKNKILALVKDKANEITEESHNGITIYKYKDSDGKIMGGAFIDESYIANGNVDSIKKVIDLSKGKGKNVRESLILKPYLNQMKADAILSFVFGIPQESRKISDSGMFKFDLRKAEAIIGYVDYANRTWSGLIQLLCKDEQANQQMASALNMFKTMGALLGNEGVEFVSKINITATKDSVKIDGAISEDLLERIQKKLKEKQQEQNAPKTLPSSTTAPQANN